VIIVFPGPGGYCSIHHRPDILTPGERARGIELAQLPAPEAVAGQRAQLMGDLATGEVWYEYQYIPPDPLGGRVEALERATGTGGNPGEKGIAKRMDSLEERVGLLEGA